jgi:anti-anti-sigma regulatory factor
MPFVIQTEKDRLLLELSGSLTIQHAHQLSQSLKDSFFSHSTVTVQARDLEDIDTCILQLLVSVQKTSSHFTVRDPSSAFRSAAERSGLGRELCSDAREAA